ncbi:MAG: DUF4331 domain-containing protein [Actinobacteria bacterium]|nr:DUF4331 domain-containing protein [Actinomycetota bacterium]
MSASSHREAPAISQDPTADNTDVYAFRTPDDPATTFDESSTATLIANYVPFEEPAGGPNFHRFSDDVRYEIRVDNTGEGWPDVRYVFRFKTEQKNPGSFLYNSGKVGYDPATKSYTNLNTVQTYRVTRIARDGKRARAHVLGMGLLTPPNNVGPASTPNYATELVPPAIHDLGGGSRVFAGQRDDPFFVDLGGVFDLLSFRSDPPAAFSDGGVDALTGYNVQTIALQVPITDLTVDGSMPTDADDTKSVIGVYATAERPTVVLGKRSITVGRHKRTVHSAHRVWRQVSRLGQPLVNEVLIPVGQKDRWNASNPSGDARFERQYTEPELAAVVNKLYDIGAPTTNRQDLKAILLTGIPPKNPLGAPTTQIGTKAKAADLLRLNLAPKPTPFAEQNRLGLLAGQADGYPNGRRLVDDTVDIAERAVAGALAEPLGLPAPNGTNAALAGQLGDGVNENDQPFLDSFPYVATPISGFDTRHDRPPTAP